MNICIIGAGYVGLTTSAILSNEGFNVYCQDIDKSKITMLKKGILPFFEPNLINLLKKGLETNKLKFTSKLKSALQKSRVVIICVGTPSLENGDADISQLESLCNEIGKLLTSYKVIAIKSTVPPGTCNKLFEIIEKSQSKKCSFDIVSNPEFLREGSSVRDMYNSDRIIIGTRSKKALKILRKLYSCFNSPIIDVKIESAELIKYASNVFLANKVSFINEFANLCEKVNADILEVSKGVGLDKRIGSMFLDAGIGFGGSCFPKDIKAIINEGLKHNLTLRIPKAVYDVNEEQKKIPIAKLEKELKTLNKKNICIWGLSFKADTDDLRESPAIYIIKSLLEENSNIKIYDPLYKKSPINHPRVVLYENIYQSVVNCDALIITTNWEEFKTTNMSIIFNLMRYPLLVDGKNIFNPCDMNKIGFYYNGIGLGSVHK